MDNFIGIVDFVFVLISQFFQLMLSNWLLLLALTLCVFSLLLKVLLTIGGKNN